MKHFLLSSADGIITDEIILARNVQAELDERTDLQILEDALENMWN